MPVLGAITSAANSQVRYVRTLHKRRVRYREGQYILEGHRLVSQVLQSGGALASVFVTAEYLRGEGADLIAHLPEGTPVWEVSPDVLALMADTTTPQGVLAVASLPLPRPEAAHAATLLVVLDNLRDPGNLGTILRTCQAAGAEAVLLSRGCVDPYAPKVVRAGMGAHLAVSILPDLDWPEIGALLSGKQVFLADARGEGTPWEVDWRRPSALIVGSEAHGPGEEAWRLAQWALRLPMAGGAESLNAAIATAVFLFEARRQRYASALAAQ